MRLSSHAMNLQTAIRLRGLEPERIYTDKKTGAAYYGAELMNFGLPLKAEAGKGDYKAYMWELE